MASPRPWTLTISSSVFRGSSRFSTGRPNAPSSIFRSAYSKRSRISRVARTRPTMSRCSSSATELPLLLSPQTPTRRCPLRLHPRPPPPLHPHATLLLLSPQPPRTKYEALPGNCLLAHSLSRGNEGKTATAGRSKIKRAAAVTGPPFFNFVSAFLKFNEIAVEPRLAFPSTSRLHAGVFQIVLGLLLGVFGRSLGVCTGIQQMNRFVQALRFLAIGNFATGHISARMHSRDARAQAIEVERKIAAGV